MNYSMLLRLPFLIEGFINSIYVGKILLLATAFIAIFVIFSLKIIIAQFIPFFRNFFPISYSAPIFIFNMIFVVVYYNEFKIFQRHIFLKTIPMVKESTNNYLPDID